MNELRKTTSYAAGSNQYLTLLLLMTRKLNFDNNGERSVLTRITIFYTQFIISLERKKVPNKICSNDIFIVVDGYRGMESK